MNELCNLLELDQLPGAIRANHRLWHHVERRYEKPLRSRKVDRRIVGAELEKLTAQAFIAEERRWLAVPSSWLRRLPIDRSIVYEADRGNHRYDVRAKVIEQSEGLLRLSLMVRYFAASFLDRYEEKIIELRFPASQSREN